MHSSLWKFFNSLSAYVCVFFVSQIDKTIFFYSNTRRASIESFILSYYSVFYTLIKQLECPNVGSFLCCRSNCWLIGDYVWLLVYQSKRTLDASQLVKHCILMLVLHFCLHLCPHTSDAFSLSDRNYDAYVSSFPNYYREIVLCVVTCCVYNYLFSHERRKNNESIWSWYVAQIPSHGYLSSQWPEQMR